MTFVLDNSIAMRWLFNDGEVAEREYARFAAVALIKTNAIVPSIWPLEVANVIARSEAKGQLFQRDANAFIDRLSNFRIDVDPDSSLFALSDTLRLARTFSLTSYDSAYLELSMRSGLPLATLDHKLKKAAGKAGVEIFS